MSMKRGTIWGDGRRLIVGWRILIATISLAVAVTVGLPIGASDQDSFIDREAKIKAAYLYQFIHYVQWPEDVFADEQSPLVIGVVGEDSVNEYLQLIAEKRTAAGRRLVYKKINTDDEARLCHIVFVSDVVAEATTKAIVRYSQGMPVLLVGEKAGFVDAGGVISFIIVDNNVRLRLSMKTATDHRLKISSQLAKLAEIVN